jgi:hypothetical protein
LITLSNSKSQKVREKRELLMDTPICPILSATKEVNSPDRLCVQNDCALYLPQAKKCSLVFLGYKAMLEVQALRQSGTYS